MTMKPILRRMVVSAALLVGCMPALTTDAASPLATTTPAVPSYAEILSRTQHMLATHEPSHRIEVAPVGQTITYVTQPSYRHRAQGHDWVRVTIERETPTLLRVTFDSRQDIKKPTCSFTGLAYPITDTVYRLPLQPDRALTIAFNPVGIRVTGDTQADRDAAMYPCSGGGSLIGDYDILIF